MKTAETNAIDNAAAVAEKGAGAKAGKRGTKPERKGSPSIGLELILQGEL
jgi:hypothetical protein